MLKKISALVKSQSHLVLATAGEAGPHASLMAFAAAPDASEFWLATLAGTRKYANLQADPRASLLLDDRGRGGTAGAGQALGVTAELAAFESPAAERAARRALLAGRPGFEEFLDLPGIVVLRLIARRFQLFSGPTEFVAVDAEKKA